RVAGPPGHKLLGGCRGRAKAYASTHPNMGRPENYAEHAVACRRPCHLADQIDPLYYWDPATPRALAARPSHVGWGLEGGAAGGDEMVLMYDPWGTYHIYEEALQVGRELEKLNFYWYEHPMPEHRVEPYVRLARELSIPICSPEIVEGMYFSRADWIVRGAA